MSVYLSYLESASGLTIYSAEHSALAIYTQERNKIQENPLVTFNSVSDLVGSELLSTHRNCQHMCAKYRNLERVQVRSFHVASNREAGLRRTWTNSCIYSASDENMKI